MTPPIDPAAVQLRIRSLVALHGSSQEVVRMCGIGKNTLDAILLGKCLPNSMTLAHLCKGLKVSADWILFGEVQP